jgi:acylphosphatase
VIAVHIIVTGMVQGVSFRAIAQRRATQLGLVGWVRNLPDGSVEMHAEGPRDKVEEFIEWCHRGSSNAVVEEVIVEMVPGEEGLSDFFRR